MLYRNLGELVDGSQHAELVAAKRAPTTAGNERTHYVRPVLRMHGQLANERPRHRSAAYEQRAVTAD